MFLRQQLGKEVSIRENRAETRNVDAWELYQKAQVEARDADVLAEAEDTVAAERKFARTDSLLAQAEARDPKWDAPSTLRGWLLFRRSRMAGSAPPSFHAAAIETGSSARKPLSSLSPTIPTRWSSGHAALLEVAQEYGRQQ